MFPGPGWLALGIAIAIGLTVVFAAVFALGERLFPSTTTHTRGRVNGESKRRREIRDYLEAIGEEYTEDYRVDSHTVAFYLLDRDVAITFDGVTFFGLEDSTTYGILVEHEMPGAHLGARLPFETPDVSFPAETTTPDQLSKAYAVLGVSVDATDREIRSAYRERVKEVHPDHGGDEEEFQRVQDAYTAVTQASE